MFDIGATELLMIVIVAVVVIGPKDMPLAMRTAGRWIGKMRRLSAHFRTGLDAMVREAEMEEMEKKWKAQNEKIMREHPADAPKEMEPTGAYPSSTPALEAPAEDTAKADTAPAAESAPEPKAASAEAKSGKSEPARKEEPQLPLDTPPPPP